MSCKNAFKWYAKFGDSKQSIEHDPWVGPSLQFKLQKKSKKAEILQKDCYVSIRVVKELTRIPKYTVNYFNRNLGKWKLMICTTCTDS